MCYSRWSLIFFDTKCSGRVALKLKVESHYDLGPKAVDTLRIKMLRDKLKAI